MKRKTNEEFLKEVFDLTKGEYSVLEEYKGSSVKIKIRHNCKSCNNYKYEVRPDDFFKGNRCPKCYKLKTMKTTKTFKKEVKELVKNEYSVLEEYVNNRTKIKMRHNCNNCNNHEYYVKPNHFLEGRRCPKCASLKLVKTAETFKKEVYDLVKDEYFVLTEYKNAHTKIKMRHNCESCNNYEYYVKPTVFLEGRRCPKCSESHGEKLLSEYLLKKELILKKEYKFEDCKDKNCLKFDFALFNKNSFLGLIEFDGIQHFESIDFFGGDLKFLDTLKKDFIKTEYSESKNFPFLRIKYNQLNNIENILDDFLSNSEKYIHNHFYELSEEKYYEECFDVRKEEISKIISSFYV